MREKQRPGIIAIGDRVPVDFSANIHSIHAKVLNFLVDGVIISLCAKSLCPGPYRIVLDLAGFNHQPGAGQKECQETFLLRRGDQLIWGYWEWDVSKPSLMYQSGIKLRDFSHQKRQQMAQKAAADFKASHHGNSYAEILAGDGSAGFDRAILASFSRGEEHLKKGQYPEAVKCFKGLGYGLTPAGDDFLMGFLLALRYLDSLSQKKELQEICPCLFFASLGENPLVNTFLQQAMYLEPDYDWREYICALSSCSDTYRHWQDIISRQGHSSGRDRLCGFLLGLELIGHGNE
ncbi:MAG: DUF2877 domain-containing protein [Candidatus Cloacimonadaceae bacterium]|nr:DUF2877 domain-containing protein [Candidatus Cloacimonadaceae bacterium]